MNIFQIILIFVIITLVVFACFPKKKASDYIFRYEIDSPTTKTELPESLKEISGLSFYNQNQLACVNDEKGIVFIFDVDKKAITEQIDIGKDADYEGIEVVGDEIFTMKSNGKIKGFKVSDASERKIDCTQKGVKEYEGLGYNSLTNSLLLVTKEQDKSENDKKTIFAYNLSTGDFGKYLTLDQDMIKGSNDKKAFAPSGIAVHPITGEIFVISSQGKKLLILSPKGKKNTLIELNADIFVQPEGICFAPNGDLYISSEGKDEHGYILKFGYK